jgi:hypothetical protein
VPRFRFVSPASGLDVPVSARPRVPDFRRLRRATATALLTGAIALGGAGAALAGPTGGAGVEADAAADSDGMPALLERIAACESGGDPTAISRDGRHRGKYQFSLDTWRSLGGRGDPAEASEALQDRLALELYRREGTDPWPSCGRAARKSP